MASQPVEPKTFLGHPRGLYVLFFTELWERFSFYGMRALLVLYMVNHFVWSQEDASSLLGTYAALAYGTPVIGGFIADRFLGAKRSVIVGAILLSVGHFLMAFEPLPFFYTALGFIIAGVGFLKPNISTQVGNLYKPGDPRRDGAFTLFYMGINLGALFGPILCDWLRIHYGFHYGFGAAGVGMILGLIVYVIGQRKLVEFNQDVPDDTEDGGAVAAVKHSQTSKVVSDRIIVLFIVFAFVILFWMAFEQSANVMVVWADKHTNLCPFSSEPPLVSIGADAATDVNPTGGLESWAVGAGQTQSFNPLFIILLAAPLAALWAFLDKRKLQPSTPGKMVLGLIFMALAFLVFWPAAKMENRASSAPLAAIPAGLHLGEDGQVLGSVEEDDGTSKEMCFGATRLRYDSSNNVLNMHGVLTDLDRLQLLSQSAPGDFQQAFSDVVSQSEQKASESGGEDWELAVSLPMAPDGVEVVGDEAAKILKWDSETKTLTVAGEIKARAEIEFLATAAEPEFKAAVDRIYLESSQFRISIWWLILHFLLITVGELCLSPVGLSLVTKMAPPKYVGLFMGGWFLATAVAEKLAHVFGGMWGTMTPSTYFMIFVVFCGVGGLFMAILVRPMRKMMHGIH